MANEVALVTANRVEIVESVIQMTLPTAEAVTAGMAVRLDTTNGKWTKANGSARLGGGNQDCSKRAAGDGDSQGRDGWLGLVGVGL